MVTTGKELVGKYRKNYEMYMGVLEITMINAKPWDTVQLLGMPTTATSCPVIS